jgi:DNA-binding NtrC family response regulator
MPKGFEWNMKKRILIVDDDISIRSSLQKILSDSGYEVSTAPDGDSAQNEFRKADLLILDLNLPIQDGWDVLGHVNSSFPLMPVIVITGMADQLDERTIPGASAFLEKPIEVPALLRTMEHLLSVAPEERLAESSNYSDLWQTPSTRPNSAERRTKAGARGLKRFKSL